MLSQYIFYFFKITLTLKKIKCQYIKKITIKVIEHLLELCRYVERSYVYCFANDL